MNCLRRIVQIFWVALRSSVCYWSYLWEAAFPVLWQSSGYLDGVCCGYSSSLRDLWCYDSPGTTFSFRIMAHTSRRARHTLRAPVSPCEFPPLNFPFYLSLDNQRCPHWWTNSCQKTLFLPLFFQLQWVCLVTSLFRGLDFSYKNNLIHRDNSNGTICR